MARVLWVVWGPLNGWASSEWLGGSEWRGGALYTLPESFLSSFLEDSSLAVQSSGEVRLATAVFPILSLLNHSCCPNTSVSFSLGLGSDSPAACVSVTVRTSKDVAAGQELLHCYGRKINKANVSVSVSFTLYLILK